MKLFEIDKDSIVKATSQGYMYCTTTPPHKYGESRGDRDKKYVYYHRALMEQKIGRYLKEDEEVDHIDGNLKNNDISNLRVIKSGVHQKNHSKTNHFWKKSPRNKKASILNVITNYLKN